MTEEKPDLVITNDLYLAAYLVSNGCELRQCGRNARRRISFVIQGVNSKDLREKYRSGTVELNMKKYRDAIHSVRILMDQINWSNKCPSRLQNHDPQTDL